MFSSASSGWVLAATALGLVIVCGGCAASSSSPAQSSPAPVKVYLGTFTKGWACDQNDCTSKGIYVADFDPGTGALSKLALAAQTDNPSYLAVHPSGKYLYAVNEVVEFKGAASGAVSAFAIEASGSLRLLNQLSSNGAEPCHVSVTAAGGHVLVANCGGGSVASFLVGSDGRLQSGSTVKHAGRSVHPNQMSPHAHFIAEGVRQPGLVYVADLGLDQVLVYHLDRAGKLTANDPPFTNVAPGSGPRHLALHPRMNIVYTNNELSSTVTVFALEPDSGTLTERQTITTLPEGFAGVNATGEIQLSKDGRFVYVSNRGHNSIARFAVHAAKGTLTATDHTPTQGNFPRDFKLDPTGGFVLVAHHKSDDLVVFAIDKSTGRLAPAGGTLLVSKPVNLAFAPVVGK